MKVLLACLLAISFVGFSASALAATPEVHVARIEGPIDERTAGYVERVISSAEEAGVRAVVLEIDTPGGSLGATQEIVRAESNASGVPVISYVGPRGAQAASAGTFVMMGSDVAAMAPQTRLGAAHPVAADGGDIPGDLRAKATNDAAALMAGLAEAHGRNGDWAEDSVRESAAVDAAEALELGIVEHVEPDLRAVLDAADGERVGPKDVTLRLEGAAIVQQPPTFAERTGIPRYVLWGAAALAALFVAAVAYTYFTMRRWRVSTGVEGMIGEIGTVRRPVLEGASGWVFVHGELWRALPESPDLVPMKVGAEVEVVALRRGAVVVRPIEGP
jgi:membrane-bound ClpP family serine protease